MKKGKSIALLTTVCIVLIAALVMTFVRFSVGIYDYNSVLGAISFDYEVEGGVAYTLTFSDENDEEVEDIDSVLKTIKSRLNELGYQNSQVKAVKSTDSQIVDHDIRIETKYTSTLEADINTVAAYGTVKFYGGTEENPTTEILSEKKAIADARYLGASRTYDNEMNEISVYGMSIHFTDYGYDELVKLLDEAKGSEENATTFYFKIVLDENTLYSGSLEKDAIANKTFMLSTKSEQSAKQFVLQMKTGGLAYRYDVSSGEQITGLFGENTKLYSLISLAVIIVAAVAVASVMYKGYGAITALSLLAFMVIELAMLIAVPGITVSFAGILGVLLATVFAVDGIFTFARRFSEEFATGKTVKAGLKIGFKRSFRPILNSNVIAGVIALALIIFTNGLVQNFAITFGIGVVVSFISSVLIAPMFTFLILPLLKNSEKFFNLKREDK